MKYIVTANEGFKSHPMSREKAKAWRKELIALGNYNVKVERMGV